jgi:hypothetical protein
MLSVVGELGATVVAPAIGDAIFAGAGGSAPLVAPARALRQLEFESSV